MDDLYEATDKLTEIQRYVLIARLKDAWPNPWEQGRQLLRDWGFKAEEVSYEDHCDNA